MKTIVGKSTKRLISFVLVLMMLFSIITIGMPFSAAEADSAVTSADSSVASVGASGVSGDSTLFNTIDSQTPYIRAEKSSYDVDTPVLLTADTFGKYPDAVIALYEGKDKTPTTSDKPVYTFQLSGYEGQTIDIKTGEFHSNNTGNRPAYLDYDLNYTAVIHPNDATLDVIASANVNIDNAVRVKSTVDSGTSVEVSRKVFRYGEGIVVKGTVNQSAYPGAWVGVYQKGVSHTVQAPEYIIPIGSSYSTNYNGTNRWIVHSTHSLVNKNMELEAGDYTVKILSAQNPMTATVLCEADFSVVYSITQTDKSSYGYGEDVITYSNVYNKADASIQNTLQCTGTDVAFRNGPTTSGTSVLDRMYSGDVLTLAETSGAKIVCSDGKTSNNWARLYNSSVKKYGYMITWLECTSDSDVKIYGTLNAAAYLYSNTGCTTKAVSTQFAKGTPYNYLDYTSNSAIKVQIGGYTGYIKRSTTGTTQILQVYRLHDTSGWPTYDANARVALYQSNLTPANGVQNNGYYYLDDAVNSSMIIQENNGSHAMPAGDYKLHLFGTSGYTTASSKTFTVSDKVTAKFSNGAYEVDNLNDGFANGRVAFEVDPLTNYGYVGNDNTNAVVYWAGADQKPLAGYASFSPVALDKNVISFDMQPYSIIPEGATGLVAYVEFNGVRGEGFYLALPEGCKTYTGLDSGIISEFNVLSDTKVGNTNADYHYDDHFATALTDIANNGTSSQAIVINGDITNSGTAEQFGLIDSMANEVTASTGKTLPPI
ncbi:MAG: hypothetical protein II225_03415 [Ruminococcus sp.]|nr:hypothetical protein [Ruminococcus sp.]